MASTPPDEPSHGTPQPGSGQPPSPAEPQRDTPPQQEQPQQWGYRSPQSGEQQGYAPPPPAEQQGYGAPQPGQPAHGQEPPPAYGQPEQQGYAQPPAYGQPQQYSEQGYAQPGGYAPPPGYGQQAGYGQPGGYAPPQGYGQPGYPAQAGWGSPAYGATAGQPASWGRRVGQYLIDALVLVIPAVIIFLVLGRSQDVGGTTVQTRTLGALGSIVLAIVVGAYFTLTVAQRGATVGMSALGMRVAREEDGGTLPLDRSAFRAAVFWVPTFFNFVPVIGSLLGLAAFVSFLWPLWDRRKQALHDKLGRALVVRT